MVEAGRTDRVHVAISPIHSADNGLLKAMSEITGQVAYDLRLKLKGSLPKSIMLCSTMAQAKDAASRLGDLDLTTIVYRQDDLPREAPFAAYRLAMDGSTLNFSDRRGSERTLNLADVALMVHGRREIHSTHAELKCERRYRYGGMGMGALGASYMHAEVKDVHNVEREDFLLLFTDNPDEPAIEFRSRGVDYSCLGRHMRRTNPANHQLLVTLLRKLLADAPFDGRLSDSHCGNHYGEAFFNRDLSPDSSWACATLIYWELLAEGREPKHFNGSTRGE